MFGFSVRTLTNGLGSPNSTSTPGSPARSESPKPNSARLESPSMPHEVGEIDTRAPFESVRAAVSLFADSSSPRARPVTKKTKAEEQKLLEKEAQHHMVLRELEHYKNQLKSIENAKARALREMRLANKMVQELTNQLEALSESKQAAIHASDAAKGRTITLEEEKSMQDELGSEGWKVDVDAERELYKTSSRELISTKQELTNLRQDFDAALEAKLVAFQQEENAKNASTANKETHGRLSGELAVLNKTLDQVKLASLQAEEEHMKLIAEKEIHLIVHKSAKEAADLETNRLKEENGDNEILQEKLEETEEAVAVLQKQLTDLRTSDLTSLQGFASELDCAKKELEEAKSDEAEIRSSVDALALQVEEVRIKLSESMKLAAIAEAKVEQLQAEIRSAKAELNKAMSRDIEAEMQLELSELLTQAEKDRQDEEEMTQEVEITRKEAEAALIASQEIDDKLDIAEKLAEAAKAASKHANEQIYKFSRAEGSDPTDSGSIRKIKLSAEKFKSMSSRIEVCTKHADERVETLRTEMQAVMAREKEVQDKVAELMKECEMIQSEIDDSLKQAEVTEAAKIVAEDHLRKGPEMRNSISTIATSIPQEK